MPRATWKDAVLAEAATDDAKEVEGNVYFPPGSVARQHLRPSDHHTTCPWKGEASYYHVEVNGELNENAAWFYPEPKDAAREIKDHVAFWKGVHVSR